LQRLKSQRAVVRKALATLPKDLDETYERIFLRIPQDDWLFVPHAFQWLSFYDELGTPPDGTPSVLLLEAIDSSTVLAGNANPNVLYDLERLRELCGCLISCSGDTISFAHYTVKEYLESARIREGPLSFFSTELDRVLSTCLDVIFLTAKTFATGDLEDLITASAPPSSQEDLWRNLVIHCLVYAIPSINKWGKAISTDDVLFKRVKALLGPSTQHFRHLEELNRVVHMDFTMRLVDICDITDVEMARTIV
jgi:hypothetical protein